MITFARVAMGRVGAGIGGAVAAPLGVTDQLQTWLAGKKTEFRLQDWDTLTSLQAPGDDRLAVTLARGAAIAETKGLLLDAGMTSRQLSMIERDAHADAEQRTLRMDDQIYAARTREVLVFMALLKKADEIS
ncbi:MAG: hypothetical protein ABH823_02035 [bacterium]